MAIKVDMSIENILAEINYLKLEIATILEKLRINSNPVKAISYKEVLSKSNVHGDLSCLNLIKSEELREELESKINSALDYKKLALRKIREMSIERPIDEMIVFYRDKLRFKWKDIATLVDYSEKQCKRKYDTFKRSNK